jgi:uncharacterized membrane protein (DUF2068 family)
MPGQSGLRAIALFEAAKGAVVLAAGVGALEFVGRDTQSVAEDIVRHFHLNPAHGFPRIFMLLAEQATPAHLWILAGGAAAYAGLRFMEAYGLWNQRRWAEWFALISSGLYVPIEVWELGHGLTRVRLSLLAVNMAILGYVAWTLKSGMRGSHGSPVETLNDH